jgi:hypothetical protein
MKREDFNLVSVKLRPNQQGVIIRYRATKTAGGVVTEDDHTQKINRVPHPDFVKAMQGMTIFLAIPMHLTALSDVQAEAEKLDAKAKKVVRELTDPLTAKQQSILDQIDVRGISLSGKEENQAVIISGYLSYKTAGTAINSPRMKLSGDFLGNEIAMAESIDEIIDEAYQHLFKNKQAQLSAFGDED